MIELTNEIENNICDAIQVLIDASIQKNQTDNTIKATIISCTDALTGEYKIKYQDNTLTAYSGDKDVIYKKDTLVYVHVPNNNLENKKTILGAVDKNAETYVNSVSEDSTYKIVLYQVARPSIPIIQKLVPCMHTTAWPRTI